MQQLRILQEMTLISKEEALICIKNNLERCNQAYKIYKENPIYLNAKHIYASNEIIYFALCHITRYQLSIEEHSEVINFIFHLENWFSQFRQHEKEICNNKKPLLQQTFKFLPLEKNHIPFPTNFSKIFNL